MNRVLNLNNNHADGKCVLYVMSRDQRVHDNHAILTAQELALDKKLPLVVLFNLLPKTGYRSREHYDFMIEGLKLLESELNKYNIGFIVTKGSLHENTLSISEHYKPSDIIFDFSPLKNPRKVQKKIAHEVGCSVSVVDAHNIVPCWKLSDKEEFGAYTIRTKIHKELPKWLGEYQKLEIHKYTLKLAHINDWVDIKKSIDHISSNGSALDFKPGEKEALKKLNQFIESGLDGYAEFRNDPTKDFQSNLSPYLHFGHISAQTVALKLAKLLTREPLLYREPRLAKYNGKPTPEDSINVLLEELIVRKELADNYCFYNENYDNLEGARNWARDSLEEHRDDVRDFIYSFDQWKNAQTHDQAWNAAQKQMIKTGKMHGYMRMYWAKKILEWSETPEEAIKTAVQLNDTYSLDGGDPNGYTGIMWSIAGIHDRSWFDREVFGKIRYMNRGGLERRFDVEEYINQWQ